MGLMLGHGAWDRGWGRGRALAFIKWRVYVYIYSQGVMCEVSECSSLWGRPHTSRVLKLKLSI